MWIAALNVLQGLGWTALGGFSLHTLWLLSVWLRRGRVVPQPRAQFDALPRVTVQLPIFNERYVVQRLLQAAARLDYPKDRLEIQVLDDSTDDTPELVAGQVAALQANGYAIHHVRRTDRSGYKAGALAEGLRSATGEFIALFDADFVPPADFLRRTIDHFTDPAVGMVQTRWGHLNREASFLTRAQALMLDGHFLIEQVARSRAGVFFNFNGSAGIWRAQAIVEAGGWQSDTLAEDIDLSYRALLRGWRFVYRPDVVVPAELPTDMGSLKIQHRRWAQGSIQAALKLLPAVLRSRQRLRVKIAAIFHFGNWFHYPLGLVAAALILPQLVASRLPLGIPSVGIWSSAMSLLLVGTTTLFHLAAQWRAGQLRWALLFELPMLMAVSVGLAVNNSLAIWHALRGTAWSFQRTPKYGDRLAPPQGTGLARWAPSSYRPAGTAWGWTELALGAYLSVALAYATTHAAYSFVPFLLPVSAGFLYSGLSALAPGASYRATSEARPRLASVEPADVRWRRR